MTIVSLMIIFMPLFLTQVRLTILQLTAGLKAVVRMLSVYVRELLLCVAVCQERQAGLRLSAIQVGQGTHNSKSFDFAGMVKTVFICSAEMMVLCCISEVTTVHKLRNPNFVLLLELNYVIYGAT
jgi:hypothetical protein